MMQLLFQQPDYPTILYNELPSEKSFCIKTIIQAKHLLLKSFEDEDEAMYNMVFDNLVHIYYRSIILFSHSDAQSTMFKQQYEEHLPFMKYPVSDDSPAKLVEYNKENLLYTTQFLTRVLNDNFYITELSSDSYPMDAQIPTPDDLEECDEIEDVCTQDQKSTGYNHEHVVSPKRKGRAARIRDVEKFRLKINNRVDAELRTRLVEEFQHIQEVVVSAKKAEFSNNDNNAAHSANDVDDVPSHMTGSPSTPSHKKDIEVQTKYSPTEYIAMQRLDNPVGGLIGDTTRDMEYFLSLQSKLGSKVYYSNGIGLLIPKKPRFRPKFKVHNHPMECREKGYSKFSRMKNLRRWLYKEE